MNIKDIDLNIIYKVANNIYSKYNYSDIYEYEDFIQECIYQVYNTINNYDNTKGSISNYIYYTLPLLMINKTYREHTNEKVYLLKHSSQYDEVEYRDNQDIPRNNIICSNGVDIPKEYKRQELISTISNLFDKKEYPLIYEHLYQDKSFRNIGKEHNYSYTTAMNNYNSEVAKFYLRNQKKILDLI